MRELSGAKDIFILANEGDDGVLQFLDELALINARAVSDIIVAYDPELIVFDGAVMRNNADYLIRPMIDAIDRYLDLPKIILTGLAGDAPLLGAAVIADGYNTRFGNFESASGRS